MSLRRRIAQLERGLWMTFGRPLVVLAPLGDRPDPCAARIAQAQARGQRIRIIQLRQMALPASAPPHQIQRGPEVQAVESDRGRDAHFPSVSDHDKGDSKFTVESAED